MLFLYRSVPFFGILLAKGVKQCRFVFTNFSVSKFRTSWGGITHGAFQRPFVPSISLDEETAHLCVTA